MKKIKIGKLQKFYRRYQQMNLLAIKRETMKRETERQNFSDCTEVKIKDFPLKYYHPTKRKKFEGLHKFKK